LKKNPLKSFSVQGTSASIIESQDKQFESALLEDQIKEQRKLGHLKIEQGKSSHINCNTCHRENATDKAKGGKIRNDQQGNS
jgi:hypothetical protein